MREFLARNEVEHGFEDVRKNKVSPEDTITLVRQHRRAMVKQGVKIVEFEPAKVDDAMIRKHFLGREGTLRAPTVSVGDTIVAGWDEATFAPLLVTKTT